MEENKQPATANNDDLSIGYANNVFFEPTVWDLKLIFGEFSGRSGLVDWHTSITIPWAQVKLMHFYLGVNIEAYEAVQGKIHVPETVLPTEPEKPDPSDNTGAAKDFYDMVVRHRQKFLSDVKK